MIPSTSPIEKKHSLTPHPVISDSEQPCRRSKTDFFFIYFWIKTINFIVNIQEVMQDFV